MLRGTRAVFIAKLLSTEIARYLNLASTLLSMPIGVPTMTDNTSNLSHAGILLRHSFCPLHHYSACNLLHKTKMQVPGEGKPAWFW